MQLHPASSMSGKHLRHFLASLVLLAAGCGVITDGKPMKVVHAASAGSPGALVSIDKEGHPGAVCPLKHTDVKAEITGFLARVNVAQEFENPLGEKIEAVYTFPLPQRAAVDDMTIVVGDRTVKGKIKRREEARKIYEEARQRGHLAGLLDQERPNIFTQSVTNIGPGMKVKVQISYVETLQYEGGSYEFSFPMVVGPRYVPGSPTGAQGGGWSPDTDRVPDASRITPPVTPPATRAGHDISVQVSLDAGVPLESLASKSHPIDLERSSASRALVRLRNSAVLPNKDFILTYDVAGRKLEDALLTHRGVAGGYFTFILQPPERVTSAEVTPKEIVFVIDTSGSMSGFPIEKSKEVIKLAMDSLHPHDTFNLITFAGDTQILFDRPVPATPDNVRKAQQFLLTRQGSGGTEMMKAIRAALEPSDSQEHIRVVCFLTDGYVGNDMEIIGEVKKHPNARVFSFGIGNSVNRFLLDKMAEEGRGEVEYVSLNDDGSAAARRFHERVRSPLLADVSLDWGNLPVADIYPKRIQDLFSAKPLVVAGRYTASAAGTLRLRGKQQGREFVREISVRLPETEPHHDVLATLWARTRIDDLMNQDWNGMQSGSPRAEIRDAIVELGLKHRLMTQFTSFVAVEETFVTEGGRPRRIEVPVEMPEGVSYEGVFGEKRLDMARAVNQASSSFSLSSLRDLPEPAQQPRTSLSAEKDEKMRRPIIPKVDAPQKLDSQLQVVLSQVQSGVSVSSLTGYRWLRDGKASVKVWLTDSSPAVIDQLKKAGLEVLSRPGNGKLVLGRVLVEKLAAIAALDAVMYISPDIGQP